LIGPVTEKPMGLVSGGPNSVPVLYGGAKIYNMPIFKNKSKTVRGAVTNGRRIASIILD
jgi:hypothetical protein